MTKEQARARTYWDDGLERKITKLEKFILFFVRGHWIHDELCSLFIKQLNGKIYIMKGIHWGKHNSDYRDRIIKCYEKKAN
jgi:hypothetical protein